MAPTTTTACVDPHAHAELDPVQPAHFVGQGLEPALDRQGGAERPLGVTLVRDRRPEQRHHPVAEELVDRPFVAVHLVQDHLEGAVHDGADVFGVELFRHRREARYVREQDRHLPALAFEGGLRVQNSVGEVLGFERGRVRAGRALRPRLARRRGCGPGERVVLAYGHALVVDKLLDDLRERVVVERELSLEHPVGQAAALFEVPPHLVDDLEQAHIDPPVTAPPAARHVPVHRSPGNPARPITAVAR